MFTWRRWQFSKVAFAAVLAIGVLQGLANADFNAPLVQCSSVTKPISLSGCGSDALTRGAVRIGDDGSVQIVLNGAGVSTTYSAAFFSPDASASFALGSVATDAKGNGHLQAAGGTIPMGNAGAGTVVLSRSSMEEYVSGIIVAALGSPAQPDFRSGLIMCSVVNDPKALSGCGTDLIKPNSFIDIEGDDGDLTIQLKGAAAKRTYTAVLRAINGSENPLGGGTITTDAHGNGFLVASAAFSAGSNESGTVVIKGGTTDEFFAGFHVTHKPGPTTQAKSGLVRCLSVNLPASGLTNCGTDPLSSGSAVIDNNGKLTVSLMGAEPNATYEVFFRPLNGTGTTDVDTKLSLTTDQNGNVNRKNSTVFVMPGHGTVGAGSFIVEGGGLDQFVPGFVVQ